MNAIAEKARAAAMQFESKKDGLKQLQSGEWTLSMKVHADDVPAGLLTAPMGTRYQVVIVELGDDEQPVEQKPAEDNHRLSRQAAMLCGDTLFTQFISEMMKRKYIINQIPNDVAECVRRHCQVQSRSEFDTDPEAAKRWRDLHADFEGWKIT